MSRRSDISMVDEWPVVWRVTAPGCGNYNHDMVMHETEDQDEAVNKYRSLRRCGWPVRLERVSCGPLPDYYDEKRAELWKLGAQNPSDGMREVPGCGLARRRHSIRIIRAGLAPALFVDSGLRHRVRHVFDKHLPECLFFPFETDQNPVALIIM